VKTYAGSSVKRTGPDYSRLYDAPRKRLAWTLLAFLLAFVLGLTAQIWDPYARADAATHTVAPGSIWPCSTHKQVVNGIGYRMTYPGETCAYVGLPIPPSWKYVTTFDGFRLYKRPGK
jgi:hypothetical protein